MNEIDEDKLCDIFSELQLVFEMENIGPSEALPIIASFLIYTLDGSKLPKTHRVSFLYTLFVRGQMENGKEKEI